MKQIAPMTLQQNMGQGFSFAHNLFPEPVGSTTPKGKTGVRMESQKLGNITNYSALFLYTLFLFPSEVLLLKVGKSKYWFHLYGFNRSRKYTIKQHQISIILSLTFMDTVSWKNNALGCPGTPRTEPYRCINIHLGQPDNCTN